MPAARGERGAALILVMAFLLVIAVVTASLFSLAYAGTRSMRDYQLNRALRYSGDGALEVGVRNVAADSTLGVTNGSGCSWDVPVTSGSGSVVQAGSKVRVTCVPHTVSTGADSDGGQKVRDVDFLVTCKTSGTSSNLQAIACDPTGSGTQMRVLAKARVRFDINFQLATDKRAVVPKVLTWNVIS